VNYDVIPGVVYTLRRKSRASARAEDELKVAGIAYTVGKFPFTANGRARANRATDGFVKVLADKASRHRVLGRAYHRRRRRREADRDRGSHGASAASSWRRSRAHLPRPSDHERGGEGRLAVTVKRANPYLRADHPTIGLRACFASCARHAFDGTLAVAGMACSIPAHSKSPAPCRRFLRPLWLFSRFVFSV